MSETATAEPASHNSQSPVIIRMWPKTPVLYPMAVCALVCAILGSMFGSSRQVEKIVAQQSSVVSADAPSGPEAKASKPVSMKKYAAARKVDRILGIAFLIVFAISLFTVCVDFEIRWALFALAILVIGVLGLVIMNAYWHNVPDLLKMATSVTAQASPQFYLAVFFIWAALMATSLIIVRFHYVKIESNEIIVVGGFLETQKRFSTFRMNYTKEVQDVLEYYLPLVRSGRLVFTFPGEEQAVVLDNVLNIDRVIGELDKVSSTLRVEDIHHDVG